jgi:hypothetical protein
MVEPPEITPGDLALIRQMPEHATKLSNAANELRSLVHGIDDRLTTIRTTMETFRDDFAARSAVDGLKAAIDLLPTVIADAVTPVREELNKARTEIMDRIDRLQGTVELVREDGKVNWFTADTAMNRAKSYREEIENLSLTVAAMQRGHQILAAMVEELREQNNKKSVP